MDFWKSAILACVQYGITAALDTATQHFNASAWSQRLGGGMPRARLLPWILLALAAVVAFLGSLRGAGLPSPAAFVAAGGTATEEVQDAAPGYKGPLDWFHYEVILASRKSYPLTLMVGFNLYGNVLVRKECGDKRYPNWLFGFLATFVCYTYPGAVFSDMFFVDHTPMRAMGNNNILLVFTFWFCIVQYSERFYRFCLQKHVFVFLTTWWLADATRASLCFLERAVTHHPVFAKGIWHSFVWCAAGPLVRVVEIGVRGMPVPPLGKLLPDSFNPFKYPLVMMWAGQVFWLIYMTLFTDCNLFAKEGALTMVECGNKHETLYGAIVYVACFMHIGRAYYGIFTGAGPIFGDMCLSCSTIPANHPAFKNRK